MATFHKPKVFRSNEGCCICKTKSSSSRFTDSSKYEDQFRACFQLEEDRVGEICNACVLLVKRWKKLPKNNKRNWSHVVDARAGPGTKSFVKQKKKDDGGVEEFDKIRRKHHLHKKSSRPENSSENSSSCASPDSSFPSSDNVSEGSTARLADNQVTDFFDSSYWRRETVCCGVIFRGMLGEVMVDTRSWVSCDKHSDNVANNNNVEKVSDEVPMTVESLIESELRKLTEEVTKTDHGAKEESVKKIVGDPDHHDEGFCDKSSTVTGPSSPDSANLGLEDE